MWTLDVNEWDTDLPDNSDKFQFKRPVSKNDKQKLKKKKKINQQNEEESSGGLFVRIRPDSTPHESANRSGKKVKNSKAQLQGTNAKQDKPEPTQKSNKKRKHEENSVEPNDSSPLKKKKFNNDRDAINVTDQPIKKQKIKTKSDEKSFSHQLRENLKGSRFRFINEQLYQSEGKAALEFFRKDPEAFEAYHEGYRGQVEHWPLNPLKRMINAVKRIPKSEIVADFGCGEGRLAKSVPHKVYSLDLVAANEDVIACDMAHTPLKSDSINVVVFCLSLMGTNLKEFLLEANRVLKINGKLKIAEVTSRFANVTDFIHNVEKCGFSLQNKDLTHTLFVFIDFKKTTNIDNKLARHVPNFSLKPCLYKKR